MRAEKTDGAVIHEIPPVWDKDSGCLLLGTFPSPKSREAGFFYMHPQNRFWPVIFGVFGEELSFPNGSPDRKEAIEERKDEYDTAVVAVCPNGAKADIKNGTVLIYGDTIIVLQWT